jgi:hypothetical protein
MESGRLLLLLPWRAADHTLRACRKAGGVRAPAPMPATTARRRSGVTTEEHATLKISQSIHLRRRTAGKEPGGASAAMRSSNRPRAALMVVGGLGLDRVYATQVIYIKVVVLISLYLFQSGNLDRKCKFPEI